MRWPGSSGWSSSPSRRSCSVPPSRTTRTAERPRTVTTTAATETVSAVGAVHAHAYAPVDDKGLSLLHNGHHAAIKSEQPLSPADRIELTRQMNATIEVARRLPTPKDAVAAGWHKTGPYMPGIGAHFIKIGGASLNASGVMSDEALATPLAIIYDGIEPDARVAGFMYYAIDQGRARRVRGSERPVALPHVAVHQDGSRRNRPAARLRPGDPAEAVRCDRRQPAASRASGWCTSGRSPVGSRDRDCSVR